MNTTTMSAGRELDALIAEKVMGSVPCDKWRPFTAYPAQWVKDTGECYHASCHPPQMGPPHYSTDIAAAWAVVERLVVLGHPVELSLEPNDNGQCLCTLMAERMGEEATWGDTAPLAICRAALKAVAV
jgi:hypothetical protein